MSSSLSREPLSGLIRQDKRVVGAICLPEEDLQKFIDQFNHCYGPLRMRIEPPRFIALPPSMLRPVGAGPPWRISPNVSSPQANAPDENKPSS